MLALACAAARAQQVTHAGADSRGRMTESVELVDAWGEITGDAAFGSSSIRDVLVRVSRITPTSEHRTVHLLLFGTWGSFLYTFEEVATETDGVRMRVGRTLMRAFDVDADGQNEIVLVERVVESVLPLDEMGGALEGEQPRLASYATSVRVLDREGSTLVERDVAADPAGPVHAQLLQEHLDGAVLAALQLSTADFLFKAQQYEKARYRYQVVREWAEGEMSGGELTKLSVDGPLPLTDPDEPAGLWMAALRGLGAMPRRFRDL
jgi:hypothetical protein